MLCPLAAPLPLLQKGSAAAGSRPVTEWRPRACLVVFVALLCQCAINETFLNRRNKLIAGITERKIVFLIVQGLCGHSATHEGFTCVTLFTNHKGSRKLFF